MPRQFTYAPTLELDEIASYHQDVVESLRLYFGPLNPGFEGRFFGKTAEQVRQRLASRLEELDARSTFVVLTSLEAAFRMDFAARCKKKLKDELSRYFRSVNKNMKRKDSARLDEDILEGWKTYASAKSTDISEIRGAFKFRNWLAHGRYRAPRPDQKYDFDYVHLMAQSVMSGFPFEY